MRINGIAVTKELMDTKQPVAYIPEQVSFYRVLSGFEKLDYFFQRGRFNQVKLQAWLGLAWLGFALQTKTGFRK